MKLTTITTESGSRYHILEDSSGKFFCKAENVPNDESLGLDPDTAWRIETPRPWPPVLKTRLCIWADASLEDEDPARMPGGGKLTSHVADIRVLP